MKLENPRTTICGEKLPIAVTTQKQVSSMSDVVDSFSEQKALLSTFNDDYFDNYSLVWLDDRIGPNEFVRAQESLASFIDHFQEFTESDPCEKHIRSTPIDVRIILIVCGNSVEQFIPGIHQLRQISAIYIYRANVVHDENWAKQYTKVRGGHHQLDDLIRSIKTDRTSYDTDEPFLINFFRDDKNDGKSTMEVNGAFLQTQLLIDCLHQMKATDTDKDELVVLCEKIYQEKKSLQATIQKFKNTYSADQAIWWYTGTSFLPGLLNRALRVENTDLLFLFNFFIRDIEKQLKDHQCPSPTTLYRGQFISKEELKLCEESKNKLISVTSFFSTSLDPSVAHCYTDPNNKDDKLESVLFEIYADPSQNPAKPFAEIKALSCISDEQEVLMMLGSIFRIEGVDRSTGTLTRIRMTLCSHNDADLNSVFEYMRKKRGIGTARPATFGRALIGMAKFDAAENLFKRLLRTYPPDHPDCPDCYHALGKIYCEKFNLELSLKCLETSLKSRCRESNLNQWHIAHLHNSIGEVYLKKADTIRALQSFQNALEIFSEQPGDKNESVAWCLSNMGIVFLMEKKYSEALDYFKKALDLKMKLFPAKHPCLGNTYTNLGNAHCYLKDYHSALQCYQESYTIFQTSLSPQHPSIARALKNLGFFHELRRHFTEALDYYNRALDLRRKILLPTHPDVLESEQDVRRVLWRKNNSVL